MTIYPGKSVKETLAHKTESASDHLEHISGVYVSPSPEGYKEVPLDEATQPETEKHEHADGELGSPENDVACQLLQ
ncbi:MAG TPA: hypothetical protein VF078_03615 [Nitrospira sp.]